MIPLSCEWGLRTVVREGVLPVDLNGILVRRIVESEEVCETLRSTMWANGAFRVRRRCERGEGREEIG